MNKQEMTRLTESCPQVGELREYKEIYWENTYKGQKKTLRFTEKDIEDAEARLQRFAPYIEKAFPETAQARGMIESPLREIPNMKKALGLSQPLYLKCDSSLPISGSVKARGGIYEVLKLAETIAAEHGMLRREDNYAKLADEPFRRLFSQYEISVGSTGNLGLSIGIIGTKLGFRVTVHMSADARQWKKDLLREKGAQVIEYSGSYETAVAQGRKQAEQDPNCYFVDDENSADLFLGYAAAGKRLKAQLEEKRIAVDREHPLYVYLPCGVGGAPGGIAFGLKAALGDHVHCVFAEPTHAPCMTLGLMTGMHEAIGISDLNLDGKTAADGLAVGRPSALVSEIAENLIDGSYTISDESLFSYFKQLTDTEKIKIEPSACAGFAGPGRILRQHPEIGDSRAVHIVWATGGNMVPEEEMKMYEHTGELIKKQQEKQREMESYLEKTMIENNVNQKDSVNGMMKSENKGCSAEDLSLSLGFPVQPWQANRAGMMHGGMICTAFDITAAALARYCAGENYAPTVSLDVKYIRPVQLGDTLIVTAKATAAGKRLTQLVCEAHSQNTGKLAATAATVYLNVDTSTK